MSAEWPADPFGRAELRYFDGTNWTHHVANAGQQAQESPDLPLAPPAVAPTSSLPSAPSIPAAAAYPAWVAQPRRKGGRLIAAGVLGIISGVLGLLASIGYFALVHLPLCSEASAGENCTNVAVDGSGFIKGVMVVSIIFTIALIGAGIGGCMRRYWGQRLLVVMGCTQIAFDIVIMIVKSSPTQVVNIIFCVIMIGLARANERAEYEVPRNL